MQRITAIFVLFLCAFVHSVQAGVVIGGTRIIYPEKQSEVQVSLRNKDKDERYLVQSWVSHVDDTKAPFVITPPIYKLEENRKTLLHVIYTGDGKSLPQDRESIFIMNVKSVSAIPPELKNKNTLQFAVKTKIKLFWRPEKLSGSAAETAWQKLQFRRQGTQLIAKNPTPFYISFGKLTVGGKDVSPPNDKTIPSALTMMVAPFSEHYFQLSSESGGEVSWTAINDFGAETKSHKQSL